MARDRRVGAGLRGRPRERANTVQQASSCDAFYKVTSGPISSAFNDKKMIGGGFQPRDGRIVRGLEQQYAAQIRFLCDEVADNFAQR